MGNPTGRRKFHTDPRSSGAVSVSEILNNEVQTHQLKLMYIVLYHYHFRVDKFNHAPSNIRKKMVCDAWLFKGTHLPFWEIHSKSI